MNEHFTWFYLIPGFHKLELFFRNYLGRSWSNAIFPPQEHFSIVPIIIVILVLIIMLLMGINYKNKCENLSIVPPAAPGIFSLTDYILQWLYDLTYEITEDEKQSTDILPLAASLFLFILIANLIGVLPGMMAPTKQLQLNLVMALMVFFFTHFMGVRRHGIRYLKQFTGSNIFLAPLMVIIEVISQLARPITLTVRLLGNMFADHKVIAIFSILFPLFIPLPFIFLGILVSLIQAFVFTLLAIIYFAMALAEAH